MPTTLGTLDNGRTVTSEQFLAAKRRSREISYTGDRPLHLDRLKETGSFKHVGIVGCTGVVGRALLKELLLTETVESVTLFARREVTFDREGEEAVADALAAKGPH